MSKFPSELPSSGKSLAGKGMTLPRVAAGMIPGVIREQCAPFDPETYGTGAHTLYILPEAAAELTNWVQYGKRRAANVHEQQFLGLGHSFVDSDNAIQTVVTRIIPIFSASRGPTHARVVSDGNDAMLDILENERKLQNRLESQLNTDENGHTIDPFLSYGPSAVVLFGHTHPDLGCFFSRVDHQSNYSSPSTPMVTFVCDPIRRDMKAMVGTDCADMKIVVCRPKAAASVPAPVAAPREDPVEALWQQVSTASNLLLRQNGVSGNFHCYRSNNRTHMCIKITLHPPRAD